MLCPFDNTNLYRLQKYEASFAISKYINSTYVYVVHLLPLFRSG